MKFSIKGHSNFRMEINKNKEGYFVSKKAMGIDGDRLKQQCDKQKEFRNMIRQNTKLSYVFDVPEIVNEERVKDTFLFNMKYYNGSSVVSIIESGEISLISTYIDYLFEFIEWEMKHATMMIVDKKLFFDKLEEISEMVGSNNSILSIISVVSKYVKENDIEVPVGICHGDLTFSNMIFSNKIVLIDFLDTFLDTPLQDIGKLLQEVNLKWTPLMSTSKEDIKIGITYNTIIDKVFLKVKEFNDKYFINPKITTLFYVMILLRIFPYITEKYIYDKVLIETRKIVEELR